MVALMNTKAFGERFKFNPNGSTRDGWFELMRIHKENSSSLLSYILSLINEDLDSLPSVDITQGKRLDMIWSGTYPMHADAEVIQAVRDPGDPALFPVSVEIIPGAFDIWTPALPVDLEL